MLDFEDLKWAAVQLADLNRRLQQVSRYAQQAEHERAGSACLQLLRGEIEEATKTSQTLLDRMNSRMLAGAAAGANPSLNPPFLRVMPPASLGTAAARATQKIPVGELTIAESPEGGPTVRNPAGQRELILVVDDEPEILERAGAVLEDEDYRIILAKDGFEALQIYGRLDKQISLIILDFFLPVMDGDAVFDELKAINPDVQVVLSSGFAEQTKLGSMLARGLRGFIPKPYTSEKLLDQVRSVIAA